IVDDLRPLTGGGRVEDSTLRTKLDAIAKDAPISSDLEDVLNAVAESLVAQSTLLYGRLVAAAGDALAEALLPNVDRTAKMDGEEDNEQATPVATADTFPADALLPNVDTAMAELGGEEEALLLQWSEPNLYALSKIPDPTNTTIAQLRPLIDAKVALAGNVDEIWRSLIAQRVVCCFFKHAMRFFNQNEDTMNRDYCELWFDRNMTQQQQTEALGDELVTLFRSGTVLYFDRLGEATGYYKVTFLRDVECYVTGRVLFVENVLNGQTANYNVESMDGPSEDCSSEHNCVLLYEGRKIAVLDYCWNAASAVDDYVMGLSRAVGVTRGSLEKTVREKYVECIECIEAGY
ncbi:hypothetical protein DFJ73DRAFT_846394, partial [Zopfochytrium polystomum]